MAEKKSTEKIEREYVIPLRNKTRRTAIYKRTPKAVKSVKEFLAKHMKVEDRDLNKVKLDKLLNEALWYRGIRNPIHKIKVKAVKENGIVTAHAVDLPTNLKFKKIRLDKKSAAIKAQSDELKKVQEKAMKEAAKKAKEKVAEKKVELKDKKVEEKATEKKEELKDKKAEEKEKKTAVVEAGAAEEKKAAKEAKHTTKVKAEGKSAEQISEK